MTNHEIILEAMKHAQEEGRKNGFKVGDLATHPRCEFQCEIVAISDSKARLQLFSHENQEGVAIDEEFPLDEIFDASVAKQFVTKVLEEDLNRNAPAGSGVFVVDL